MFLGISFFKHNEYESIVQLLHRLFYRDRLLDAIKEIEMSEEFEDQPVPNTREIIGNRGQYRQRGLDGEIPLDESGFEDFEAFVNHYRSPALTPDQSQFSGDSSRTQSPSMSFRLLSPVTPAGPPLRFELIDEPQIPSRKYESGFNRVDPEPKDNNTTNFFSNFTKTSNDAPIDLHSSGIKGPKNIPPNSPFVLPEPPHEEDTNAFIELPPDPPTVQKFSDIFFQRANIEKPVPQFQFLPQPNPEPPRYIPTFQPPKYIITTQPTFIPPKPKSNSTFRPTFTKEPISTLPTVIAPTAPKEKEVFFSSAILILDRLCLIFLLRKNHRRLMYVL